MCARASVSFALFFVSITDSVIHISAGSREYLPELARARAAREKSLQDVKEASLSRFMSDLAVDRGKNPEAAVNDRWESEEENGDEDEDLEVDIIDQRGWYLFPVCAHTNLRVDRRGTVAGAVY